MGLENISIRGASQIVPHTKVFIVTISDGRLDTFLIIKFETTYEQPAMYIAKAPINVVISVTNT